MSKRKAAIAGGALALTLIVGACDKDRPDSMTPETTEAEAPISTVRIEPDWAQGEWTWNGQRLSAPGECKAEDDCHIEWVGDTPVVVYTPH